MNRKKVLVTGSDGQLGSSLLKLKNDFQLLKIIPSDLKELDITSRNGVYNYIMTHHIDYIINTAAYTAVDKAENEESLAFSVNSTGPQNLALVCKTENIPLIHISTDYVFSGTSKNPYKETDPTEPAGVYGRSKLAGETCILDSGVNGLIVRTSWLYSEFGSNFVKSMIRLGNSKAEIGVVFDQTGSPTFAENLAHSILTIINGYADGTFVVEPAEIYHYTNQGSCSWFDLAKSVMELAKINCKVKPITTDEFPLPAKRPQYSVLDTTKIRHKFGLDIPNWHESLSRCIDLIK